jgi:putative chitinase
VLTVEVLLSVMPRAGRAADRFVEPLNVAAARYEIANPARLAMWLAIIGHESADLTTLEENLNYSAEGLANTWPGRFREQHFDDLRGELRARPTAVAQAIARNPERIANLVYADRMGNGAETSGDGWLYRGRGPIQITGRDLYRKAGEATGYNLETSPELALEPMVGALVAGWVFAVEKDCCGPSDQQDIVTVTRRINGGLTGLEDRRLRYARAKRVLAV